jgi:hypothetical protein
LVAIDKFTKWIEVKPVTCPRLTEYSTSWMNACIATDYPHRIITDLGSNFNNHQFWEYCESREIDV